jgi:7-alpha-hydroxysteroid dehydrogenase
MIKHTPIHRLGESADMTNAARFLCAPASAWISGQSLTISGGGTQDVS